MERAARAVPAEPRAPLVEQVRPAAPAQREALARLAAPAQRAASEQLVQLAAQVQPGHLAQAAKPVHVVHRDS